jgi:hypothetical protein
MHPHIRCQLVADPLGSAEHTLGIAVIQGVSGGILNILGGGSMGYSEQIS